MSDTYKIKAMLDTSDVKRGAQEIERDLSASTSKTLPLGGGGASSTETRNQIDEHNKATYALEARTTATHKLIETQHKLSTEQKAGMILGGGTAAAALAGAALKAGGMDTGASALTGAANGAARLGTMLAPLGPQAALIGAAAGGITGALTSLVGSMGSARKALAEEAAKAKKDADELRVQSAKNRADEIISRKQFEELAKTDPEAAQTFLAGIKNELKNAMIYAKEGAPIEQDLKKAALYYPEETSDVIRTGWDKGALTRDQKDLGLAINASSISDQKARASGQENWAAWNRLDDVQNKLFQKFPEIMSRASSPAYPEQQPGRAAGVKGARSESATDILSSSQASTGSGSVDPFQSIGLGIYSNPMRRSEQLLQSIDGKLAIITRRPQTGVLL